MSVPPSKNTLLLVCCVCLGNGKETSSLSKPIKAYKNKNTPPYAEETKSKTLNLGKGTGINNGEALQKH